MILSLPLPKVADEMTEGFIAKVYVAQGSPIEPGAKLFDIHVDLSAAAPQDCPPMFQFRILSRERGWIQSLHAVYGKRFRVDELLATIRTGPQDESEQSPVRSLRYTTVGILGDAEDWLRDLDGFKPSA